MPTDKQILEQAQRQAQEQSLPYAGSLLPADAYAVLQANPEAKLVDVRTRAEWEWVGSVPGAVMIEWNTWPGGKPNLEFLGELQRQVAADAPVLFLCRSGGRSHNAATAAAKAGYRNAYNILQGFEGDRNDKGQRGSLGGWRRAGLPWSQG